MWPIPALNHNIVSVLFLSDSLVCSWIQQTNTGTASLSLNAYARYHLTNLELENLVFFNPTVIKKYISSFLQKYNLQDAFIVFSMDGPAVTEKYMAMPTSTPRRTDFGIGQSSNVLWDYRYIYSNEQGQYLFYVYIVPRFLILQYQLLAIAAQCNVIAITTCNMALLDAYKHIFGVAFRRSQLAIDMMRYDNKIENCISVDALRRMITIPADVTIKEERVFIAAACGLFYAERTDI